MAESISVRVAVDHPGPYGPGDEVKGEIVIEVLKKKTLRIETIDVALEWRTRGPGALERKAVATLHDDGGLLGPGRQRRVPFALAVPRDEPIPPTSPGEAVSIAWCVRAEASPSGLFASSVEHAVDVVVDGGAHPPFFAGGRERYEEHQRVVEEALGRPAGRALALEVDPAEAVAGEGVAVTVVHRDPARRIRTLRGALVLHETAQEPELSHRDHAPEHRHTSQVHERLRVPLALAPDTLRALLSLPPDGAPTFHARRNHVEWIVEVVAEVEGDSSPTWLRREIYVGKAALPSSA